MKCPECEKAGTRSTVYGGGHGTVTCMGWEPFWDEDGTYHNHDPNFHSANYRCSLAHEWHRSWRAKCPAEGCDWGGED